VCARRVCSRHLCDGCRLFCSIFAPECLQAFLLQIAVCSLQGRSLRASETYAGARLQEEEHHCMNWMKYAEVCMSANSVQ